MRLAVLPGQYRSLLAVSLLAAGTLAWAALPMSGARPGAKVVLIAAIACAVLSLTRLAVTTAQARAVTAAHPAGLPAREYFLTWPEKLWQQVRSLLIAGPWPQLMIVAVLGLEVLHPDRPWHTALLGVVLLGYLTALYLTESGARLAVLAPQLPPIAAGLGLAVLSVGAAELPARSSGSGSGWLAVLAAIAAIVAAALALPV